MFSVSLSLRNPFSDFEKDPANEFSVLIPNSTKVLNVEYGGFDPSVIVGFDLTLDKLSQRGFQFGFWCFLFDFFLEYNDYGEI